MSAGVLNLNELIGKVSLGYKLSEESFLKFVVDAWHTIEPGRKFMPNWHIKVVCEHLEAVTRGEITRLIINIPPGSAKSTLVSVMWPVWSWIHDASLRFLAGSHNKDLAVRDIIKSRDIINSPWFQLGWSKKFVFSEDQNQKTRYKNNKSGYRMAFGIKAGLTGEKADIILLDDPQDAMKAQSSETDRHYVNETFDIKIATRIINPVDGAFVIIMQRLHIDDLTGHLLNSGEHWEHVCLPMEFDPNRRCITKLGVQDKRTVAGELLWPERFPKDYLETTKKHRLGSVAYAGQMNQVPSPPGGSKIKRAWFNIVEAPPINLTWYRYWDLAFTAKSSGDFTASIASARGPDGKIYFRDMIRGQWEWPEARRNIVATALREKIPVGIESNGPQKGFVSDLLDDVELAAISIRGYNSDKDKLARANPWIVRAEANLVHLVNGSWVNEYLNECEVFTGAIGNVDDQIDTTSGAYLMLSDDQEILVSPGVQEQQNVWMG